MATAGAILATLSIAMLGAGVGALFHKKLLSGSCGCGIHGDRGHSWAFDASDSIETLVESGNAAASNSASARS